MDEPEILFFVEPGESAEELAGERGAQGARDGQDTGGSFENPGQALPTQQVIGRLRAQGQVSVPVSRLRRQVSELVEVVTLVFDQAERQVAQQMAQQAAQQRARQVARQVNPDLDALVDPSVIPAGRSLQLEEIELTVEVNAEGQLGILGSGGKAGGKGGIKLKFTRKSS